MEVREELGSAQGEGAGRAKQNVSFTRPLSPSPRVRSGRGEGEKGSPHYDVEKTG